MNVLQVSPSPSYPPTSGGDHRTHGIVKSIPGTGDTVIRYAQRVPPSALFDGSYKQAVEIEKDYKEIRNVSFIENTSRILGIFKLPSSTLLQFYLRFNPTDTLTSLVQWADIIIVEGPWQVQSIVEMTNDVPVLYSSHNVEFKHYNHLNSGITKPLFKWVYRQEKNAVQMSDGIICVSERDLTQYRETWAIDSNTFIAPNAVYEDDLMMPSDQKNVARPDGVPENQTTCLFVGTDRAQNEQAARTLVNLAPSFDGHLHIVIAGSVGKNFSTTPSNVTTTGFVDALYPYYHHADIALNPVTTGAGTNIKLLEYFANRVPVVSTPFGVRGYDVEDGYHVTVTSDSELLESAVELSRSGKQQKQQIEAGFEFVKTQTWSNVSANLLSEIRSVFGV
ncbi:glycosyltransferase [Halovenus rubra]|uniref:Glycosyltransferase n=2 Tax=Halovenus rubra TaxID=869890 RepID=A0ABD5X5F6_9EURY|nr:glycosyltransferase [Halovenus rubra]